jgi:hypothetical protein
MATLSATEIVRVRMKVGDSHPTTGTKYDLTDAQIQAEWDTYDGHGSETNEYRAYYSMLEMRRGIWLNAVDTQTEQGSSLQNQKLRNIERLMAEYKSLAGIGAFTMQTTAGVFDFGIDQDDPITGADLDD